MRSQRTGIACLAFLLLGGCMSGNSALGPNAGAPAMIPSVTRQPELAAGKGMLVVRVRIPTRFRTYRARYVSMATKGMTLALSGAAKELLAYELSSQNPDCTGTPLLCTIRERLPVGDYTATANLYDEVPINGKIPSNAKLLSTAPGMTFSIAARTRLHLPLALTGVPASITIGKLPAASVGTAFASPQAFRVKVFDPVSELIIGPYEAAVTLSTSDTTGATTITTSGPDRPPAGELVSSADTASLGYNGAAIGSATIGAAAGAIKNTALFTPAVITEYQIPTGGSSEATSTNPTGIVEGPDGALWFAESTGNQIGRITTGGSATEYPIPTASSDPFFITVGPDRALWFTELEGNQIGRISTAGGTPTEYPVPTRGSFPYGIATGPDGALWFAECRGQKIGRITTGGQVTAELPLPAQTPRPEGVVTGPDGALWFTEALANQIGRMTTAGTVLEYSVPTPDSRPFTIIVGPDKALWFTECSGNKIGRITTTGAITEYSIPSAGGEPFVIAAGSDGALWFTESLANKIGRITTAATPSNATITEYSVPQNNSGVWGIAAGPDGAMWFTEEITNKIGRIPVAVAQTAARSAR